MIKSNTVAAYGDVEMLKASGILPAGDAPQQAEWRALAWRMVEMDVLPNCRRQTILSREWIAAHGWSVALFLGLPDPEQDALCALFTTRGYTSLLGTPTDFKIEGHEPGVVWRIPNGPEEECVPFNNFLLSQRGLQTMVFPEDGSFAFHTDEDGEVNILAGPADLIRAATSSDPAAANARYRSRALEFEQNPHRRYLPEALSNVARQYDAFLLQD